MNRNRLVQLVSLVLAVVLLIGTMALTPTINRQRAMLFDNELVEGIPPKYALAAAALGSFRGLAVDVLWYRAEMLKREGKFFDAKTLRDWITTLQPRFPKVWAYQAWDMAYNISVATHTPEERWDWVNKGIRLLREQGIPHNPTDVGLYRELAWIFFHKVGQYTDDMHWYYKLQLASEWQEILGAPTEGASTEQALAHFKPIADAAEAYFLFDRPSREVRQATTALAESHDALREPLEQALERNLVQFTRQVGALQASLRSERADLARRLDPVLEAARQQLRRAGTSALTLMLDEAPQTRPIIERLQELGLDLDVETLRRIGRLDILIRYASLDLVRSRAAELLDPTDQALLNLIADPSHVQAMETVRTFLRAKVLLSVYHMDPVVMYELMEAFGPMDWRHPAAHAAYWAYLGVQKSGELRDATKIDVLNTDRQVIHAMQSLFHYGRVNFDPLSSRIDLLPDPRFAEAYNDAMKQAIERAKTATWAGGGNVDSFEAGHENFLLKAIVYAYLYGDQADARAYYQEVRTLYGSRPHNLQSGRYQAPLQDFVMRELQQDMGMLNTARPFVEAMLQRAFTQGLANGRTDVFNRYVALAQQMHASYQRERAAPTGTTDRDRLLMLPFSQTLAETYIAYMQLPQVPILERARVYANTPLPLQQQSYARFRPQLVRDAGVMGFDPARLFPPPPGLDASPMLTPREGEQRAPSTIERR